MKIGIITFHWGANHGAVLQAYALSKYLSTRYDADVEIIDYCPANNEISLKNVFKSKRIKVIVKKVQELRKEKNIRPFRKKLNLTKRYYTTDELIHSGMKYDILITGSDQVWNPFFVLKGEGQGTLVYFLDFGNSNTKKLSVSASFGAEDIPTNCKKMIIPLLKDFCDISVRENSGKKILSEMGIASTLTADPTALLSREHYLSLGDGNGTGNVNAHKTVSKMILRCQSPKTKKLIREMCNLYRGEKIINIEKYPILEWISAINNSKMVITNSFHCVVMCLKLHVPFFVVPEDGKYSGMNDRFKTLLGIFGLEDRIISSEEDMHQISPTMDFERIDVAMNDYALSLKKFLDKNI